MSRNQPSGDAFDRQLIIDSDDGPPHPPVDDQRAVLASYFEGTGRVVVDASAGTGKTSTLVLTLAETIVRTATDEYNPLSEMLVTTFGREATAELKTRLKELLRHHQNASGDLPESVFRWIETDSHIQTLDSCFAELLEEIAIEIGVPPDFEVDNRLESQRIRQDIFAELREEYRGQFRKLESAYPAADHREYPPQSVESMLYEAHQRCREFGISPADAVDSLHESLEISHGGHSGDEPPADAPESIPPETIEDVEAILRAVVDRDAELEYDTQADAEQLLAHVRSTYFATEEAIDAFGTLLVAFEQRYDRRTRQAGQFTFIDVAHLLYSHLEGLDADDPYLRTLGGRFDHVFVDEFQDTSAVQCGILRRLVDASQLTNAAGEPSKTADQTARANLFVIGDSKQAIYEWRSADPALFAEIIEAAKTAAPQPAVVPHLQVRDVQYHALSTVFRHHPDIAAAANHCFQRLLEDDGRGAIGEHAPSYVPVEPHGSPWGAVDEPTDSTAESHVHVLNVGATRDGLDSYISADDWGQAEAERVAETIGRLLNPDGEPSVTIQTDEGPRAPTPGDITLLFRSRRQLQRYARVLRDLGIPATADASGDLFEQREIELLVDILLWIATPYSDRALRRLLRSPLVGLADETIRAALQAETLESFWESWPDRLPDDDRQRLAGLLSLRADLSHHRETAKTALIGRLIEHSGFEAILLGETEPLRRYGNVWLLAEVVDEWELDELLSYREFASRLRQLRASTDANDPQVSVAETTDPVEPNAVQLKTVHQAKGQEYPIVFLCDLPKPSNYPRLQHKRLLASRRHGFALRPRPAEPPSPEGVTFPTPDSDLDSPVWFNDDFESHNYPDATGPIWLSDDRTESGAFRYSNPLNAHITAQEAEFWRLAYVAFTRAEDHVFLGLGELDETESEYYNSARWSTWLAGFNETLQPDTGWDEVSAQKRDQRTIRRGCSWSTPVGEQDHEISIGVDEIPPHDAEPADIIELGEELSRLDDKPESPRYPAFRPMQLTASSLGELADCPRAFQYRQLQGVKPTGGHHSTSANSTPSTTPAGLSATEWGDIVHRLIEVRLENKERAEPYLDRQSTAVCEALQTVQSAIESTAIFGACQSPSAEVFVEYELSALLSTAGADLRLTGIIDLLYQLDGEWHIVDWKTGTKPADGAAQEHRRQLSVYAWLLNQQFGITVETATIVYIDPSRTPAVSPIEIAEIDTRWVESAVQHARDGLPFDTAGLEARPDAERCESCPFAEHNGGPCVDDYHTSSS